MTELRCEPLRKGKPRSSENREEVSRGFFQARREDGILLNLDTPRPFVAARPFVKKGVGLRDAPSAVAGAAFATDEALPGETPKDAGNQGTADASDRNQVRLCPGGTRREEGARHAGAFG